MRPNEPATPLRMEWRNVGGDYLDKEKMTKLVAELEGADLDYWVARALYDSGQHITCAVHDTAGERVPFEIQYRHFQPSTNGQYGVPIIDREHIHTAWGEAWSRSEWTEDGTLKVLESTPAQWYAEKLIDPAEALKRGAQMTAHEYLARGAGPTMLVAAMRCYVASKFGDTVETI